MMRMSFCSAGFLTALGYAGYIRVVANVYEARNYLAGIGQYRDRFYFPFPDVVVSDMKLPGEAGIHLLRWVRDQPEWKGRPFFTWTGTSTALEKEIVRQLGGIVLLKSGDFAENQESLRHLLSALPSAQDDSASSGTA
jgi:CheY-like chemotaxis protein